MIIFGGQTNVACHISLKADTEKVKLSVVFEVRETAEAGQKQRRRAHYKQARCLILVYQDHGRISTIPVRQDRGPSVTLVPV